MIHLSVNYTPSRGGYSIDENDLLCKIGRQISGLSGDTWIQFNASYIREGEIKPQIKTVLTDRGTNKQYPIIINPIIKQK